MVLTMDHTTAINMAHPKPEKAKPPTSQAVISNSKALIIMVNKPKVMMLSGNVNNNNTGLTSILSNTNTKAGHPRLWASYQRESRLGIALLSP